LHDRQIKKLTSSTRRAQRSRNALEKPDGTIAMGG
jgi:hypothetical protein